MQTFKLWKLTSNGNQQQVKADVIEAVTGTDTEQLLENVLTSSPGLLLPDLWLVGRQTPTPGGPLDLLGVDEDGHLVVFELKRGTLTRDAVAQAVDYASYLADLTADDLCRLISENSGKLGIEKMDFRERYETEYPDQSVTEIGVPRIVLVGLGAEERAKRMVQFLGKSGLDISLTTFYGFKLPSGETLLARQLEVRAPSSVSGTQAGTKARNQASLNNLLAGLGITENYKNLEEAVKKGLAESAYEWPNPTGYTFSLQELADSGKQTLRAYLSLYVISGGQKNGKIQIMLHARAVDVIDQEAVHSLAKAMGTKFERKSKTGPGEIVIDGHNLPLSCAESLTALAQAITAGWKAKTVQSQAEEVAEAEVPEIVGN